MESKLGLGKRKGPKRATRREPVEPLPVITVERCRCGFKNDSGELACSTYWLVGVGHFVQGSGFTKEEAERVAAILNGFGQLASALQAASDHLEWTGYGDNWERECARSSKLEQKIEDALKLAKLLGVKTDAEA